MKVKIFNINEGRDCRIKFVAENQQESSMLYKLGSYVKKPIKYYGKVDETETWAWLFIPLNSKRHPDYFGNDDE